MEVQIAMSLSFLVISLLAFSFLIVKESWNLEMMMVMGKASTTIPKRTTKLPVRRPRVDLQIKGVYNLLVSVKCQRK